VRRYSTFVLSNGKRFCRNGLGMTVMGASAHASTACQRCAQSIGHASAWRLTISTVPLAAGLILEATDAESVPITAVHGRNEERRTRPDDLSIRASVEEVHRLVTQVVCTLSDPTCQQHPSSALQSARARALTLLDQLEKLIA